MANVTEANAAKEMCIKAMQTGTFGDGSTVTFEGVKDNKVYVRANGVQICLSMTAPKAEVTFESTATTTTTKTKTLSMSEEEKKTLDELMDKLGL